MSPGAVAHRSPDGRAGTISAVAAAVALVVAVVPALTDAVSGPWAWVCFAAASGAAGLAMLAHPRGLAGGVSALFVTIAIKDAVLVVPGTFVNLFHVVTAGLVIALTVSRLTGRRTTLVRVRGLDWGLIALLFAGLWSLPASVDAGVTLVYLARLLLMITLAVLVSRLLPDERDRLLVMRCFVVAALVMAGFALVQWLVPDLGVGNVHRPWAPPGVEREVRPAAFYLDPNFMAAHLVVGALVALGLAGTQRRWLPWAVSAAALLGVVAITLSRSAWVGAAVGLIVLVAIGGTRVRRIALVVVAATLALGVLLVGPQALLDRAASTLEVGDNSSNDTRLFMMRAALEMFADHPVSGTGLGTFDRVYPSYRLPAANPAIDHPHQVPLTLMAEAGLGGIAAMLIVLVTGGVAAMRLARRGPVHERAILAALTALAVGAFFQYYFFFEVAWLSLGLLAAASTGVHAPGADAASASLPVGGAREGCRSGAGDVPADVSAGE